MVFKTLPHLTPTPKGALLQDPSMSTGTTMCYSDALSLAPFPWVISLSPHNVLFLPFSFLKKLSLIAYSLSSWFRYSFPYHLLAWKCFIHSFIHSAILLNIYCMLGTKCWGFMNKQDRDPTFQRVRQTKQKISKQIHKCKLWYLLWRGLSNQSGVGAR